MNETENKNETTTEQTSETTTETVPEKELSPEEKLAEREKAFELKSIKSTAEKNLKSKGIPTELSEFKRTVIRLILLISSPCFHFCI